LTYGVVVTWMETIGLKH